MEFQISLRLYSLTEKFHREMAVYYLLLEVIYLFFELIHYSTPYSLYLMGLSSFAFS
jgi:cellulose synthase/poly-beta-1,6-N-acetylglucosamine synthase-like glycosyltransferase